MSPAVTITVGAGGTLRMIYSDAHLPLMEQGEARIRRASHVEPDPRGGWTADLTPERGPVLGPFPTHAEAISAEIAWLTEHVL